MPEPERLVLDLNNDRKCVYINITDDNIVEGLERFEVRFTETDDNQINIAGTDTVPVYIEDDEGKYIHCGCIYMYVRWLFVFPLKYNLSRMFFL